MVTLDFSAIYEMGANLLSPRPEGWCVFGIVLFAVLLLLWGVVVWSTSVQPVEVYQSASADWRDWINHYVVFVSSMCFAVFFGILVTIIHVK